MFFVGHNVHHIQARLSFERPWEHGRIIAVSPDGWIDIETPFDVARRWTHDTDRLLEVIDELGSACDLREQGLLSWPIECPDGTQTCTLVSVGRKPTPCSNGRVPGSDGTGPVTTRDLLEELQATGGLLIDPARIAADPKDRAS